jgi:hypothetical protein
MVGGVGRAVVGSEGSQGRLGERVRRCRKEEAAALAEFTCQHLSPLATCTSDTGLPEQRSKKENCDRQRSSKTKSRGLQKKVQRRKWGGVRKALKERAGQDVRVPFKEGTLPGPFDLKATSFPTAIPRDGRGK